MNKKRRLLAGIATAAALALSPFGATTASASSDTAVTTLAQWKFYSSYSNYDDCNFVGGDGLAKGWWSNYKNKPVGSRWELWVYR